MMENFVIISKKSVAITVCYTTARHVYDSPKMLNNIQTAFRIRILHPYSHVWNHQYRRIYFTRKQYSFRSLINRDLNEMKKNIETNNNLQLWPKHNPPDFIDIRVLYERWVYCRRRISTGQPANNRHWSTAHPSLKVRFHHRSYSRYSTP